MALLVHSFLIEDKDRTAAPLGVVPAEGGPGGASEEAMQPPGVAVPASGGTSGVPGAGGVEGLPLGPAGASGDAGAPLDPTGAVGTTVAPPGQASAQPVPQARRLVWPAPPAPRGGTRCRPGRRHCGT